MNLWIMAFPCLVYFASVGMCFSNFHKSMVMFRATINNVAMGTILTYQSVVPPAGLWSAIPYFSISLSLNVLLTLMIIIRLILHARNTRTALGITGIGGLCKTIVTMFIESCALYAVNSLLFIVPWGTHNYAENIFLFILSQTQVRALPRSRPLDRLSNTAICCADYRSTTHHSTSRQQECVDEKHYGLRTSRFAQSRESGEVDK